MKSITLTEQSQTKESLAVIVILVLLMKLEKLLKYKILILIGGKNVQEEYISSLIDRKQSIIDVGGNKMTDEERAERIIRSKMSIEEAFSK